jgi:hypothetical protein
MGVQQTKFRIERDARISKLRLGSRWASSARRLVISGEFGLSERTKKKRNSIKSPSVAKRVRVGVEDYTDCEGASETSLGLLTMDLTMGKSHRSESDMLEKVSWISKSAYSVVVHPRFLKTGEVVALKEILAN